VLEPIGTAIAASLSTVLGTLLMFANVTRHAAMH
jgi:hypothetical protein